MTWSGSRAAADDGPNLTVMDASIMPSRARYASSRCANDEQIYRTQTPDKRHRRFDTSCGSQRVLSAH